MVSEDQQHFNNPSYYINRELSWLAFNRRVLAEANDEMHPLLEQVKFLAICGNNLDEFFMVRVSGLRHQVKDGVWKLPPDGTMPSDLLWKIQIEVDELNRLYEICWREYLMPRLEKAGISIISVFDLTVDEESILREYFRTTIYPILTPMAIDAARPFPFISNLSINLAVVLRSLEGRRYFARLKIPSPLFGRFIPVGSTGRFILLEDLVADNLALLFPGMRVEGSYRFRLTRDAEIKVVIDEASDLLSAVEESVECRRTGVPVRLEVDPAMPTDLILLISERLGLKQNDVYGVPGFIGHADLWQLHGLARPDLLDEPFIPFVPVPLSAESDLFAAIRFQDFFFYHPYDSFNPLVRLLRQAATDRDVLAIKITFYRIDKGSPIIDILMKARQHGKQVTVVLELKAKFDEQNNITWARTLEQEGVHVVYGHERLKIHAKLCMIVRRESDGICRYVHLSSGNYNTVTTKIYGDIGYLTANPEIAADVTELFNLLTGYVSHEEYRKLLVAPVTLRQGILDRIDREIRCHQEHGDGYIALKLNGLLDPDIIAALYRASCAGVRMDLNVRGLCALRPGIPGVSENITITSIVGRFLEHARIYHFHNGGDDEVLLGSSDMMQRNLRRRVEVLFPVLDAGIKRALIRVMKIHLKDDVKSWRLHSDGKYEKIRPVAPDGACNSQAWLIKHRGVWHGWKEQEED
ncbi:MAG: polyphosphate kinase 1 [Methanocalculus sp.]|uniref:polyphosphate kinase 1 n=1 Tax=Methanocalculus sp. TaxID=2004547 RepID=UPI002720E114|nr:polyphosphate kinase 1 [Methanocalculus sp.]MDO9538711.1 polyphosphate kinase 1 [Methanocalculus sp.]